MELIATLLDIGSRLIMAISIQTHSSPKRLPTNSSRFKVRIHKPFSLLPCHPCSQTWLTAMNSSFPHQRSSPPAPIQSTFPSSTTSILLAMLTGTKWQLPSYDDPCNANVFVPGRH